MEQGETKKKKESYESTAVLSNQMRVEHTKGTESGELDRSGTRGRSVEVLFYKQHGAHCLYF